VIGEIWDRTCVITGAIGGPVNLGRNFVPTGMILDRIDVICTATAATSGRIAVTVAKTLATFGMTGGTIGGGDPNLAPVMPGTGRVMPSRPIFIY
jgi:hypothetical protein